MFGDGITDERRPGKLIEGACVLLWSWLDRDGFVQGDLSLS